MKLLNLFISFLLVISGIPAGAWDQANSKVLQVDQGSGISSVPNYWKSGDAEVTLTGVAAYADAVSAKPVDCTGGSPAITVARSTTAPMYDKQSWLITKPASDVQGQGVAFEFDVDNGVAAVEMMDLMFEYIVGSGTFTAGSDTTNSDIMVYLYDVTAGKLIEPYGGSKLYTSSTTLKGDYRGWFQSTLGSKKYRVCLHQALNTSATGYTLKVDAGKVQKSKHVVGTIITDWESFTPIITPGSGSVTNYTAFGMMRQVGDTYEVMSSMKFSAASATFNELYMRVPKNGAIDFNKMPLIGGDVLGNSIGGGHSYDSGTTLYPGIIQPRATNIVEIRTAVQTVHTGTAAGSAQPITNAFPFTYNSGDTITMRYAVPIVGLSAGARMSDGYDGRVVAGAAYRVTSSQTGVNPNASQVKVQINGLGTNNLDTVNGFDFTNNRYVVKTSGSYRINAGIEVAATNVLNFAHAGRIVVNGFTSYSFDLVTPATSTPFSLTGSITINLNSGDYVELFLYGSGNNSTNTLTIVQGNITNLTLEKLSGTPFMSPTALWETHYAGTAGDAIGTSDSLIKFTTKVEDTFGSYNPATGLWTAKGPATCSASWAVTQAPITLTTSQRFYSALRKDGVVTFSGQRVVGTGALNAWHSPGSAGSISVVQGTTLSVIGNSSVAGTAETGTALNYFTVSCRQSGN